MSERVHNQLSCSDGIVAQQANGRIAIVAQQLSNPMGHMVMVYDQHSVGFVRE